MRRERKWVSAAVVLAMVLSLLPAPALAAGTAGLTINGDTAIVETSDAFRAAAADESVEHIIFKGNVTVEYDPYDVNDIFVLGKTITPYADSDSYDYYAYEDDYAYENNHLYIADDVTLIHVIAHEGNHPNPVTQSLGQICYYDYDRLAETAEGFVGWYEYHDADNEDDEYAGMRICSNMYCGNWEDAVAQAAALTQGDGWAHAPSGGDDNQLMFLHFGCQRDGADTVTIDSDVKVDGMMYVMGGQNLEVSAGATLTVCQLNMWDMRVDYDACENYEDEYRPDQNDVVVKDGGKIDVRNGTMIVEQGENEYGEMDLQGRLHTHGKILIEDPATGLDMEEGTDVWSLYKRVLYSEQDLGDFVGPAGRDTDLPQLSGTLSMKNGKSTEGYIYQLFFAYETAGEGDADDETFTDGRRIGWRYCKEWAGEDGSGLVQPAGLTLEEAGDNGLLKITAKSTGTHRIYKLNEEDGSTFALPLAVTVTSGGSGGGGGGGSTSSGSTGKTETNKDGSTTTTTTGRDGTVTETTERKDGSSTTVVTKKNGDVTTTERLADGTTGTTVREDGRITEASASVSSSAARAASATGSAVALPIEEVTAAGSTGSAPAVSITVPTVSGGVKVEVPVRRVTPGAVAVIISGGRETVVPTSLPTEDGVVLTLTGSAVVKIVDNSRDFSDVPAGHWAADSVAFVTSRGLFGGTGADTFSPGGAATRGQLMTVLARLDGVNTGSGLSAGMQWAVERGISDGSNPGGQVTRQQLAVMLWRFAGSPAAPQGNLSSPDADQISAYAAEAMRWAVGNGILGGNASGNLNPQGQASRAHMAAMMMRCVQALNA